MNNVERQYQQLLADILENGVEKTDRIKRDSLKIGDIVFFRSRQSPTGWHCGLYLGDDTFAHAANKQEGVKISSLSEPRYNHNFKGAGRLD
jgi:lipoprotein Spr/probable lipoprotein NlpC